MVLILAHKRRENYRSCIAYQDNYIRNKELFYGFFVPLSFVTDSTNYL